MVHSSVLCHIQNANWKPYTMPQITDEVISIKEKNTRVA